MTVFVEQVWPELQGPHTHPHTRTHAAHTRSTQYFPFITIRCIECSDGF